MGCVCGLEEVGVSVCIAREVRWKRREGGVEGG